MENTPITIGTKVILPVDESLSKDAPMVDISPIDGWAEDDSLLEDTPMGISSMEGSAVYESRLEGTPMDISLMEGRPKYQSLLDGIPMDTSPDVSLSGEDPIFQGAPITNWVLEDMENYMAQVQVSRRLNSPNSSSGSPKKSVRAVYMRTPNSTPFDGNINFFMLHGLAKAKRSGLEVIHRPLNTGGASSGKMAYLLDRPVTIALDGLRGCTAVAVVSRKAAWMAHLWEGPSFLSDNRFTKDIIDVICVGDQTPDREGHAWLPGLDQLSAEFDQAHNSRIIIMTPVRAAKTIQSEEFKPLPLEYEAMIERLKVKLRQCVPNTEIYVHQYVPCSRQENYYLARGKFLFQYNPNEPQSNSKEQAAILRVYADDFYRDVHSDKWIVDDEKQRATCRLSTATHFYLWISPQGKSIFETHLLQQG